MAMDEKDKAKQRADERRRQEDRRQKAAPDFSGPERRSGIERRIHQERQQKIIAAEKWAFFNRTVLTLAFFFIAIVGVGVFLMAPEYFTLRQKAGRVDQLEDRMAVLHRQLEDMRQAQEKSSSFSGMINRKIEEMKIAAAPVTQVLGTVEQTASQAVTAVQQADLGGLLQALSSMDALRSTTEGQAAIGTAMDKLRSILSGSAQDAETLNRQVELARKADPTLNAVLGQVAPSDLGAAAMLLTLNEFRSNVGHERPFDQDLAVMEKFAGSDPAMKQSLDKIAPYAKNGVLSRQRLQKEFKGLAMDIVMAKLQGEDLSVQERALKRMKGLVKMRRADDVKGDSVDAVVARAQLMLDQGDVRGAMHELQTLEGAPAEVVEPWMDQAAGNVIVDETSGNMTEMLLQQMTSGAAGLSLEGIFSSLKGTSARSPYVSPALQGGGNAP